jgi:polar amino acid transport system substrate-binding protein
VKQRCRHYADMRFRLFPHFCADFFICRLPDFKTFLYTVLLFLLFSGSLSAFEERSIIVGGNTDYPPYGFIDEEGHSSGYDVELTKAIANIMGMKVEFRLGSWSTMRHGLDTGEIDILEGMSYSKGRAKILDFSIPHTVVHHSIYARKGTPPVSSLEELQGKKVSFHGLGFMHDYLQEKNITVIPVLTDTPMGALRLLSLGESDYAVVAALPATYLIHENNIPNIEPVAQSVVSVKYCYAVKKGNDELLSRINEGLAILKHNGQYQKIYDKWLGVLEPKGVPWGKIIKYGSIAGIFFLLILTGSLIWSHMLAKQVSVRTAALELEISERKKAVEELKLKQRQLIQAGKMASLGTLVSGVAHEINNPNAVILLNIDIVSDFFNDTRNILDEYFDKNGDFNAAGLSYSRLRDKLPIKLSDIKESSKKIKRIVADLKDFARQDEAGDFTPVDINSVLTSTIRLVDNSIKKATADFRIEYAENLPHIRGNAQRIEQVIINLLLNACQALQSRNEGIFVVTRFDAFADEVIIEITDEGTGIDSENIAHLTDPFFTTKRSQGGTGLGLSVSAGIVKEHHGILDFSSVKGKGTKVSLRIPAINEGATA